MRKQQKVARKNFAIKIQLQLTSGNKKEISIQEKKNPKTKKIEGTV